MNQNALRRMTLLWSLTLLILFPVLTIAGYFVRRFQANAFPGMLPEWFYSTLTLHGLGMVGAWFTGAMAGVSYLLARYVKPSVAVSTFAYGGTLLGVVLIIIVTMFGFFGVGWYFLFPLPLHSHGVWPPWATGVFLLAIAILGVAWLAWALDLLRAIAAKYSLSHALGWHYLRGQSDPEVPPIVLITTVSLIVCCSGLVAAVLVLALYLCQWLGWRNVDALLMKNLTFLFGHILVNITMYLGLGIVYELLPEYTGRPWKTNKVIAMAWNAVLLLVFVAYFHHLYMDFAQPGWVQVAGQVSSYFLSLPAAAVSIFGALNLIYGSKMRWTLASTLFVLGIMGWAIGGVAAVVDATVAVNSVFHNTLWVPAHFHTYFLAGLVFMILGFVDYLGLELTQETESKAATRLIVALLVAGGYGFLAMFYLSGAGSVPRRFAVYPAEVARGVDHAGTSLWFLYILVAGILLYAWRAGRRCLRAFSS